jgi:glycosyltransferase involved in cell wall biosynthesis
VVFLQRGAIVREFERHDIPTFILTERAHGDAILALLRRASVVHAHATIGWHLQPALGLARLKQLPCVVTLHWITPLPRLNVPIVCVAAAVKELQDRRNRCHLIHNGVDVDRFRPRKRPARRGRVTIIRVCRPERCDPLFWEAIDRVLARHDHVDLWVVGEAGRSTDRVKFLGVRRDVPQLLRRADLFAYAPAPAQGAHDLCVLEAMASGLPCVVTDVHSVNETITHMRDGVLVPFGDGQAFADAVERLVIDADLRQALGQRARQTVCERFDVRTTAAAYDGLYRRLHQTAARV